MEETHVYTVAPRKPIRGLVKGKIITKPMNLNLTKDEVIFCMKYGPVYRKFYLDGSERVTPSNLDRLHRSEHLTEAQYKALCEKQATEEETEAEVVEEAPVKETKKTSKKKAKEVEVEPEVSEVVEEESTEEEVVEESKKVEEEQSSTESDSTPIDADLLSNPVDVVPKKKSSSKSRKKKKSSTAKTEEVVDTTEATQEDS